MVVFKLANGFEVDGEDFLVLKSGDMIRAWAYNTHCKFNPEKDNTIIEVLLSVMVIDNEK